MPQRINKAVLMLLYCNSIVCSVATTTDRKNKMADTCVSWITFFTASSSERLFQ